MKQMVINFLQGEQKILKVPTLTNKDLIKKSVLSSIDQIKPKTKIVQLSLVTRSAVAGLLILMATAFSMFNYSNWNIQTQNNNIFEFQLPDNSTISMNCDSKLEYNAFKWSKERNIKCSGELFFQVEKGSPFKVSTEHGTIEVLGTKFNVFSRNNEFHTECYSGKVMVYNEISKNIIESNEQVIRTKDETLLKKDLNIQIINHNWIKGEFYYTNSSLKPIIEELERQFDITIISNTNLDRKYTGYFSNKNLDIALSMIFEPLGINYSKNEKTIIIK